MDVPAQIQKTYYAIPSICLTQSMIIYYAFYQACWANCWRRIPNDYKDHSKKNVTKQVFEPFKFWRLVLWIGSKKIYKP